MDIPRNSFRTLTAVTALLLLSGCATVAPDGQRAAVEQLTQGRLGGTTVSLAAPTPKAPSRCGNCWHSPSVPKRPSPLRC